MVSPYCGEDLASLRCAAMNGLPNGYLRSVGEGSPEGEVMGVIAGRHDYFDTENEILYVFNGENSTTTGWVAINP